MKLVSYIQHPGQEPRGGILIHDKLYPLQLLLPNQPPTIIGLLEAAPIRLKVLRELEEAIANRRLKVSEVTGYQLVAPVPNPGSCRDGYAFRQHVASARKNRGLEMVPEYDQYPVLYLTNHRTVCGPGEVAVMPDHLKGLDFELEVAIVIGKKASNLKARDADDYIAGLMILNDLSARTLQMEEMLLSLGPCKGKDFATATGPYLVTLDELKPYEVPCKPGHTGKAWNLEMTCRVNGEELSRGNLADMDWTFAELIERASYGCTLYPGDIIGSGTVGTGCLLELNGNWKRENPSHVPRWLKTGDHIEMAVTALGQLENKIVAMNSAWSILNEKKRSHVPA